jgi:hypothetical protein
MRGPAEESVDEHENTLGTRATTLIAGEPACHKSNLENSVTVMCQGTGYKFRAWVQCVRPNGNRYANRRTWRKTPTTSTATCRAPNKAVERDYDIVESKWMAVPTGRMGCLSTAGQWWCSGQRHDAGFSCARRKARGSVERAPSGTVG